MSSHGKNASGRGSRSDEGGGSGECVVGLTTGYVSNVFDLALARQNRLGVEGNTSLRRVLFRTNTVARIGV